ncbi:FadR/GntR family transcriptional regulator [Microbulbifer magnicolonia]|uniref:FadR/GntR family transcriptional regulator n=1 Tax=Microbulbifer magnicolonia TaxID=3109744 RepID=UPI002B417204|nr:FadR/GntR family transcriptional regulator [Microbulbifer sp. GG15]
MTQKIIKPLRKRMSLTAELIEQLRSQILSGELAPGDKLPTEQELVNSADVSRTVVREAVAALKADGLVITRQGVGAFVAENAGQDSFRIRPEELATLEEIINVLELRMAVEIEMAGAAAQRRTQSHIDDMHAALETFDNCIAEGVDASGADFQLHNAIAAAADNPQFVRFLNFLGSHLIPPHDLLMKYDIGQPGTSESDRQASLLQEVQLEHKAMVQAIEAGDPQAARKAARRHLANSVERHRKAFHMRQQLATS